MFQAIARLSILLAIVSLFAACSSARRTGSSNAAPANSKARDEALIKKYEKIVGIDIDKKKSLPLYQCIDKWIGTPYRYGAAGQSGTDCSGFTGNVYREVYKINLPRSSEDQLEQAKRVKKKHLKEGQLVFFKIEKGKKASHVGIYLGNGKFVHASTSKGVRIDDLKDTYYDKTYVSGGSYFR